MKLIDYFHEIILHRSLFRTFVMREIKVRYAQTVLGIFWSLLQAVIGLAIITFFFGMLLKIDTHPVPYPVFAFPGMMAWYFFSFIIAYSGSSLLQSQHLIQKVNFPKIILPISYALVGLVDFVIWTVLLFILLMVYQVPLTINLVFAPFFVVLNFIVGLSISLWLSALTIRFRDLQIIIPYLIGFGIFVTPVFFPGTMVPENYAWVLFLNPMAGIIAGLRWCFLSAEAPSVYYFAGFVPFFVLFLSGLFYFRKMEIVIPDEL
jgi:lipopolysaccharide transport system permease protein